tara:strand:- start:3475 stop:3693 length:219 start_codon:yes stop_codon:yes gene_type:complete
VERGKNAFFNTAPNLKAVMVNPYRFYTYVYLREDRTLYYVGKGRGYRAYQRNKTEIILLKQNLTEWLTTSIK